MQNGKSFQEISSKLSSLTFTEGFDFVVAIGRGGIVPGYMIAQQLGVDFAVLWMRYRDDVNNVEFSEPQLVRDMNFSVKGKSVLIVDDVNRTGATLQAAKSHLKDAEKIKTFAVNGEADYFLFNEECFILPWNKYKA